MKTTTFLVFTMLIIFSFSSSILKAQISKQKENFENYNLKKDLRSNKFKNSSFEYQLVYGFTKTSDFDSKFMKNLEKTGFVQNTIPSENQEKIIDFLNMKKLGKSKYETACQKVFQDIIVFKKANEITKIIKICTSCYANQVIEKTGTDEILLSFDD